MSPSVRFFVIRAMLGLLVPLATLAGEPSGDAPACSRLEYRLEVQGELFAAADREAAPLTRKIELSANFDFDQLPAPADSLGAYSRRYQSAAATVTIDGSPSRRQLAADAGSLLVAIEGTTPVPFLADGFLARGEAELLDVPFDPALLDRLLPADALAVGATWTIDPDLVAGLLAIDRVETGSLTATLDRIDGEAATASLAGTITGAVDGVSTRIAVAGSLEAAASPGEDAGSWRLSGGVSRLEATLDERRQAGWVAPGLDVEASLLITCTCGNQPRPAAAADLAAARADRPAGPGRPGYLWHRHPQGRYGMAVDGRWRVVEDGPEGLVMRLVDRGMLVAQCSVLPLPRTAADSPPDVETVGRDVQRSLGEQFGQLADSEATTRGDGTRVVRIVADGTAEGRPFRWIHYVLTDSEGYRAAVTFMLDPAVVERFAAADRELVAGLTLLPDQPREAARPAAAAR